MVKLVNKCIVLVIILLVGITFGILGCGKPSGVADDAAKMNKGYTVTDYQGNKLHFVEKPQRIISMSISTDDILLDLVDEKRIIAVSYLADNKDISNIVDRVKNIPYRAYGNSPEALLSYKPDLVILPDFIKPEVIQTLKDLGLKIYVYQSPRSISDIKQTILLLAELVGEPARGDVLVKQIDDELKEIAKQIGNIVPEKQKRVVFFSEQRGLL